MRGLTTQEFQLFENLAALTQKELHGTMTNFLKLLYSDVTETDQYICAKGDIPIALVAHMDTVFSVPATDIYYDPRKNVLWSPEGLGADDRAGIFAIISILQRTKLRPHIILTTDEERGCIGANALARVACPFKDLKYLVQLDRRGANDCVFYDCYNPEFISYVESFGFVENYGTFSDISALCPVWKVCGVNLSIGYYDEHSISETLHIGQMFETIDKVTNMLKEADTAEYFTYTRKARSHFDYLTKTYAGTKGQVICPSCQGTFSEYDTFPVKGLDGETKHYCVDCIAAANIEWCECCQEPYEVDPMDTYGLKMCPDCLLEALKNESY